MTKGSSSASRLPFPEPPFPFGGDAFQYMKGIGHARRIKPGLCPGRLRPGPRSRLLEQLPAHDDALDLVGALVDLGDLGVSTCRSFGHRLELAHPGLK